MARKIALRTNSGGTALLVLSGDQAVTEVSDRTRVVSRTRNGGYHPLSCRDCQVAEQACAYHSTARPWLPLSFRDAVVAAGAQNVGA